jgi:hypothetical protein
MFQVYELRWVDCKFRRLLAQLGTLAHLQRFRNIIILNSGAPSVTILKHEMQLKQLYNNSLTINEALLEKQVQRFECP